MSLSIEFEPEASLELSHASSWYEDRRADLGFDFLRVVDVTLQRLAQRKFPGSRIPGLDLASMVRRVPGPQFPYQIVYVITGDVVRFWRRSRPSAPAVLVEPNSGLSSVSTVDGSKYDLWYDAASVNAELVAETWVSHGLRASDPAFDPRAGDWVLVGDDDEPPIGGRVLRRDGDKVWVQLDPAGTSDGHAQVADPVTPHKEGTNSPTPI